MADEPYFDCLIGDEVVARVSWKWLYPDSSLCKQAKVTGENPSVVARLRYLFAGNPERVRGRHGGIPRTCYGDVDCMLVAAQILRDELVGFDIKIPDWSERQEKLQAQPIG